MNYSKHREAAKKALEENKAKLNSLDGKGRTELEAHLINEAGKEPEVKEELASEEPKQKKSKKAE
jgi:hypothetical protein